MELNLRCGYCGDRIRSNWSLGVGLDVLVYPCHCQNKVNSIKDSQKDKIDFQLLKNRVEKIELKMQAERA